MAEHPPAPTAGRDGIAIVGYGHWGPNLVRTFHKGFGRPVWICDASEHRQSAARRDWPDLPVMADVNDVFGRQEVAAVVIATPATTHFALCKAALESGKHVLCEKPLTPVSAECRVLGRLAHEVDRVLMTGFIYLFNPAFEQVRRVVESGRLGRLQLVTMERANWGPVRTDVGAAVDLATHDLSMLLTLWGLPSAVSARGAFCLSERVADAAELWLDFPSGLQARLWASWLHPQKVRRMTCIGTAGALLWDEMDRSTPVRLHPYEALEGAGAGSKAPALGRTEELEIPETEPLLEECRRFLAACQGKRPVAGDDRLAADVARVLEAAESSIRNRGAPASL
jgi:UDP-2-acetamido-3-amino-2,3-dideoxy-glucuronate N-acetyltransferase